MVQPPPGGSQIRISKFHFDLRKGGDWLKISKSDVVERYYSGQSTKDIAEVAGCSTRYIRMVLTSKGVDISNKRRPPTYKVNEDFFKVWTKESAYVVGFILTDGCISGNTITISQKDHEILRRINEVMASNCPIRKRANGDSEIYTLYISRKCMVEDLVRLGIFERKSLTVELPEVPAEFMGHFLRGVIDGDGWVHPKGYTSVITSGSQKFSNSLHELLSRRGYTTYLKRQNSVYRIVISGKKDILRLGRWLYHDPGVLFLPRKRERFLINDLVTN